MRSLEPPGTSRVEYIGTPDKKIALDTRGNTIVIAVGFGTYGLTLLLLVYAWLNRTYRPIRAKNLVLVTLMYLMAVPWYLGSVVSNGLVELVGPWKFCKLWGVWFRVAPGYMFVNFLFFRAYSLDRIFIQRKPCSGWRFYLPSIILTIIIILFCIVSQVISDKKTLVYVESIEVCHYVGPFRYVSAGIIWAILLVYAVQVVKIRNIKSSFNEFRESLIIFFIIFATILQLTLLVVFIAMNPYNKDIRLATVSFDFVAGNLMIWLVLVHPVYMCIFHGREYEKRWLRKLAGDGLSKEYEVNDSIPISSLSYSRMNDRGVAGDHTAVQLENWPAVNKQASVSTTAMIEDMESAAGSESDLRDTTSSEHNLLAYTNTNVSNNHQVLL